MIVPGLVSRGQLQPRSADPLVPPRIDLDYQAEKYLPGDCVRSAEEVKAFIRAQPDNIFYPTGRLQGWQGCAGGRRCPTPGQGLGTGQVSLPPRASASDRQQFLHKTASI